MKFKLVRHLWGVDGSHGYSRYLPSWRATGYEAVEISLRLVPDRSGFIEFLRESGMGWVPQVFSRDFEPGGTVRQHLDSLRDQIEECLPLQPLFINAHSGSDAWSQAEAEDFYGAAMGLEKQTGVVLSHETHRMRYFGNPWTTRAVLKQFPELKLTCDFSHWVCVAERLLGDCGEIIAQAARQCHHVHARVGFEEGPQVSDPRAPEWAGHLAAHEGWWRVIWKSQLERGLKLTTLTPEFGPAPYMPLLPFTQAPVTKLAEVCDWMATRQRASFFNLAPNA